MTLESETEVARGRAPVACKSNLDPALWEGHHGLRPISREKTSTPGPDEHRLAQTRKKGKNDDTHHPCMHAKRSDDLSIEMFSIRQTLACDALRLGLTTAIASV